jgi:hypothetical protein
VGVDVGCRDSGSRWRREELDADDASNEDDADNESVFGDANASNCERNVGLSVKIARKARVISSLFARAVKRLS